MSSIYFNRNYNTYMMLYRNIMITLQYMLYRNIMITLLDREFSATKHNFYIVIITSYMYLCQQWTRDYILHTQRLVFIAVTLSKDCRVWAQEFLTCETRFLIVCLVSSKEACSSLLTGCNSSGHLGPCTSPNCTAVARKALSSLSSPWGCWFTLFIACRGMNFGTDNFFLTSRITKSVFPLFFVFAWLSIASVALGSEKEKFSVNGFSEKKQKQELNEHSFNAQNRSSQIIFFLHARSFCLMMYAWSLQRI